MIKKKVDHRRWHLKYHTERAKKGGGGGEKCHYHKKYEQRLSLAGCVGAKSFFFCYTQKKKKRNKKRRRSIKTKKKELKSCISLHCKKEFTSLSLFALWQVLDYTQFYLNLPEANSAARANWAVEYSLLEHYELKEITALSLHDLADRFTQANDRAFVR